MEQIMPSTSPTLLPAKEEMEDAQYYMNNSTYNVRRTSPLETTTHLLCSLN